MQRVIGLKILLGVGILVLLIGPLVDALRYSVAWLHNFFTITDDGILPHLARFGPAVVTGGAAIVEFCGILTAPASHETRGAVFFIACCANLLLIPSLAVLAWITGSPDGFFLMLGLGGASLALSWISLAALLWIAHALLKIIAARQ